MAFLSKFAVKMVEDLLIESLRFDHQQLWRLIQKLLCLLHEYYGHFQKYPSDCYLKKPSLDRPRFEKHKQNLDRKSTRLNSSHVSISYAVFCLKKKKPINIIKLTTIHTT